MSTSNVSTQMSDYCAGRTSAMKRTELTTVVVECTRRSTVYVRMQMCIGKILVVVVLQVLQSRVTAYA